MLGLLLAMAALVCFLTLAKRRFHDMGRSGEWLLALPVLAAVGSLGGLAYAVYYIAFESGHYLDVLNLIFWPIYGFLIFGAAVILVMTLVCGVVLGNDGANKYGPDPRDLPRDLP